MLYKSMYCEHACVYLYNTHYNMYLFRNRKLTHSYWDKKILW